MGHLSPGVHRRVQAAGGGALPRARLHRTPSSPASSGCDAGGISDWVRRADASGPPRPEPLPDGRGAARAEARERPPGDRERDTLKAGAFFASRQL